MVTGAASAFGIRVLERSGDCSADSPPRAHVFVLYKVQVFGDNHRIDLPSLRLSHPLKRFVFADSYGEVSLNDIDLLLSYVPNLARVELTLFELAFARLARILVRRLHRLKRFDCFLTESPSDAHDDFDQIRAMHSYFEHMQCLEKNFGVRHFTNRRSGTMKESNRYET